jgi:hypothetical protein
MAATAPPPLPPALLRLRLEHDAVVPLSALLAGPRAPDALDAACAAVRADLRRAVERAAAGRVLLSGGALLPAPGAASPVAVRLARSEAVVPAGVAGPAAPRATLHLWQALATPVVSPSRGVDSGAVASAAASTAGLASPADRLVAVPVTLDVAVPLLLAGGATLPATTSAEGGASTTVATAAVPRPDVDSALAAARAALLAQVRPAADELQRALTALAAAAADTRLPGAGNDELLLDTAAADDVAAAASQLAVGALHFVVPSSAAAAVNASKGPPQLLSLTRLAPQQQLALATAVFAADWLAPPGPPALPPGATVAQRASAKRLAALRRANVEIGDRLTGTRRALHAATHLPTGAPLFRVACTLGLRVAALTAAAAAAAPPQPPPPLPKKPAFSLDDDDDSDGDSAPDGAALAAALAATDFAGATVTSGAAALPATVPLTDGALRQLLQRAGVPPQLPPPSAALPLRDVHVGLPLPVPRTPGGGGAPRTSQQQQQQQLRVATVTGGYEYHHYGQGSPPSDAGWGCAYRSAQTLASWLRCGGWAPPGAPVPSHRDLQQALVDCGDQPAGGGLVGSSRWIGSAEVGAALSHLYGVACRTVHCRSGAELATVGAAELLRHFGGGTTGSGGGGGDGAPQQPSAPATAAAATAGESPPPPSLPRSLPLGCPVMMGGGSLAFTLLGVAVAEGGGDDGAAAPTTTAATDRVWLLTLDPHFVGSDDPGPPDADASDEGAAAAAAESAHGGLPPDPGAWLAGRWSRRPGPDARARLQRTAVAMQGGYRAAPVSWRPVSSFDRDVFYNLCIPQRPEALV